MGKDGRCRPNSSTLARNSLVVGLATVLSRLLGFARDMLIARLLGAGPVADAFLVAFRLPNLVRRVLGEGGLNAPFVPVYLGIRSEAGRRGSAALRRARPSPGWRWRSAALTALGLLLAPWLVLGDRRRLSRCAPRRSRWRRLHPHRAALPRLHHAGLAAGGRAELRRGAFWWRRWRPRCSTWC